MEEAKYDTQSLMVTIHCLVYNHGPYLRQCLDGFVMQKTNFRFEAIVHDDVSTDDSAAIISEYAEKFPEIIKPIFETENQYTKFDGSLTRVMNEHTYGKYIAFCEGDDCWTDPLKLQKQVDFLEQHLDYSLSHSDIDYEFVRENRILRKKHQHMNNYCLLNNNFTRQEMVKLILSGKYSIQTLSVCARKDYIFQIYKDCPEIHSSKFKMGDTPLWIELSQRGKIHYLPESTATYHIIDESATHSSNYSNVISFCKSCFYMVDYFGDRYELPLDLLNSIKNEYAYFLLRDIYFDKKEYLKEIQSEILNSFILNIRNNLLLKSIDCPNLLKRLILLLIKIRDRVEQRWKFYWLKFIR